MTGRESAVSPVIGEMLMLTLVLILLPVATISLITQTPDDRIPSVTIRMAANESVIVLAHKGGDWVSSESLTVILRNGTDETIFRSGEIVHDPASVSFDLGDRLIVDRSGYPDGSRVDLVIPRAVLFSGILSSGEEP